MINMYIMKTDGTTETKQIEVNDLKAMQEAVEGYIETVPFMTKIKVADGSVQTGVAFCNEEGKWDKEPNALATEKWVHRNGDILFGNVIFLYGDPAEMRNL